MIWNVPPAGIGNFSGLVQNHFTINNLPKQAFLIVGANGNKIQSCLRIIVSFQADAFAVMNVRIVTTNNRG